MKTQVNAMLKNLKQGTYFFIGIHCKPACMVCVTNDVPI